MPKKRRKENSGLPERWRYRFGAYYYRVPEGLEELWGGKKEFLLGHTLPEAHRVYASKIELTHDIQTIDQLLTTYEIKVISQKAISTREREIRLLPYIRCVFGKMPINALKAKHVYRFKTLAGEKHGKASANRMISILSHAYTMAIEWGLCDQHPVKGNVVKFGIKPRDRYVEDWELQEAMRVAPVLIRNYVPIKLLTALRKCDILSIKLTDLQENGIHVTQKKTGKKIIIEWNEELLDAVETVKKTRKKIGSLWLFHTGKGQPYLKDNGRSFGFDSIWKRWQEKAIKETKLQLKFAESDLRAKAASDMTEEHATELLDHSTRALTKRFYRRKPKFVKPHSLLNDLHK
jgi:integrase